MKKSKTKIGFFGALLGAVLLSGCENPQFTDYYSSVRSLCPDAPSLVDYSSYLYHGDWFGTLKLPDECVDALSSLVEWDDSFFVESEDPFIASSSLARKYIVDMLYALLVYPLELPSDPHELHALGVGHAVFPSSLLCAVAPEHFASYCPSFSRDSVAPVRNLNQEFFNYLIAHLGHFKRNLKYSDTYSAYANLNGSTEIYEGFLDHPLFEQVGIILHEARHHDNITHIGCWDSATSVGWECDSDLGAMRGMTILYNEALLHGSSQLSAEGLPLMDSGTALSLSMYICDELLAIRNLTPELQRFKEEYLEKDDNGDDKDDRCSPFKVVFLMRDFDPAVVRRP